MLCGGVFGIWGEVGGSLVVLAVKRSFLCSFLGGVSCVGGWVVVSLVVLAVEWSSLCGSF